ncbi:MAG: MBL fold metallo-hydrolase [Cytophagales bacterium]|nr:MBL fold metallo-hydrolase [Cytophagales bacterium]
MRYLMVPLLVLMQCSSPQKEDLDTVVSEEPYLIILGNVQDAGSPHAACRKDCCAELFENPDKNRMVVSLGLIEPKSRSNWLFEATPDLPRQIKILSKEAQSDSEIPDGIFLTHAHIGHYSGLMFLGKESMNAGSVFVYGMPRMENFLADNGPWSQLVQLRNIAIRGLKSDSSIQLADELTVTPFYVPHRDEFSETVGYKIASPSKSALFIPDIDKWSKWQQDIVDEISKVDYAFLDATFYDSNEVNRDIAEIPHPFVIESMRLFENLSSEEKSKIHFIHFNHTNPLLNLGSDESKMVLEKGFKIARLGDRFRL